MQWSPADRIVVIPFDGDVRTVTAAAGDAGGQRRLLAVSCRQQANGGTDMYACARTALQQIVATPALSTYLPAILIMTDGRSEGDVNGFLQEWRTIEPRVPVFGITFGDADKSQLDSLAAATSGRVFDGNADLAGAFRAARGYN